jgi:hypothetical protein
MDCGTPTRESARSTLNRSHLSPSSPGDRPATSPSVRVRMVEAAACAHPHSVPLDRATERTGLALGCTASGRAMLPHGGSRMWSESPRTRPDHRDFPGVPITRRTASSRFSCGCNMGTLPSQPSSTSKIRWRRRQSDCKWQCCVREMGIVPIQTHKPPINKVFFPVGCLSPGPRRARFVLKPHVQPTGSTLR